MGFIFLSKFSCFDAWVLVRLKYFTHNLVWFFLCVSCFSFIGIIFGEVPGVVDGGQDDPGDLPGHIPFPLMFIGTCENEEVTYFCLAGECPGFYLRLNRFY
jgi:hypothetical protein